MKPRKPVKLTKQQKDCVSYAANQSLLMRGIPGSGKTTVLLERAQYLQEHGEHMGGGPKVLFLTYSSLLALYVQQMEMESGENRVQVTTFHKWGIQLLGDIGISSRGGCAAGDDRFELVKYARNTVVKQQPSLKRPNIPVQGRKGQEPSAYAVVKAEVEFLQAEFSWIKGLGKDRNRYMTEPRTGRGTGVQVLKEHREWIWAVYEMYQSMLRSKGRYDFDDVALLLDEHARRVPDSKKPSHVLIDEAQDLTVMQLRAIAKLALRSLTIAADKGQSIYQRTFSWKEVGIDVRGRSRSLDQTFRSTRQIVRLANSLQRFDPLVLKKDEEFVPAAEPDNDGPVPELFMTPTLEGQVSQVVDWVASRCASFPEDTVAIIIPSKAVREKYEAALEQRGIRPVIMKTDEGADVLSAGVKLVTFHSAKGLEFDHVAVTSLRDGTLPKKPPKDLSREDLEEFMAMERRKVFVAITRAKLAVAVFGVQPSQFITEMDSRFYQRQ